MAATRYAPSSRLADRFSPHLPLTGLERIDPGPSEPETEVPREDSRSPGPGGGADPAPGRRRPRVRGASGRDRAGAHGRDPRLMPGPKAARVHAEPPLDSAHSERRVRGKGLRPRHARRGDRPARAAALGVAAVRDRGLAAGRLPPRADAG